VDFTVCINENCAPAKFMPYNRTSFLDSSMYNTHQKSQISPFCFFYEDKKIESLCGRSMQILLITISCKMLKALQCVHINKADW